MNGLEEIRNPIVCEFNATGKKYVYRENQVDIIIKDLKALNEILALHDKWLGNEMSDFEFFTLLSEIKDKYGLSKEV